MALQINILSCFLLKRQKNSHENAGESEKKKNKTKESCDDQLKEGKVLVPRDTRKVCVCK